MKKLLGIVVLGLLLSSKTFAGDFYLKETTPTVLMEMGYKLQSINALPENDNRDFVYTFVKDKSIISCKVILRGKNRPYERHKCYNITGLER
tara:strand:- start:459 stop:734 length:276 start_codon:yes stop_codon:yes gene_type:complete